VSPGTKRLFCDNKAVFAIKTAILSSMECQIYILNYTKMGQVCSR
jgi:hypothetical protein